MFQERPVPLPVSRKKYAETVVIIVNEYRATHSIFLDQQLTHKQVDTILTKIRKKIYQLEEL